MLSRHATANLTLSATLVFPLRTVYSCTVVSIVVITVSRKRRKLGGLSGKHQPMAHQPRDFNPDDFSGRVAHPLRAGRQCNRKRTDHRRDSTLLISGVDLHHTHHLRPPLHHDVLTHLSQPSRHNARSLIVCSGRTRQMEAQLCQGRRHVRLVYRAREK